MSKSGVAFPDFHLQAAVHARQTKKGGSQAAPDGVGEEQPAASLVERAVRTPGFILLG